jgi:hypothetical protein
MIALSLWSAVSVVEAQPAPRGREPDSFVNQQRAIEERLRQEWETEVGQAQKALFDWGGWYSNYLFIYDDGVESSRTLRRYDLRLWQRVVADRGAHEIYIRNRLSFLDFNSGDSYDGNDDDVEGPNMERGYYRFDLAKAIRAGGGGPVDYDLVVTGGRDLVQLGTGLALATPLDHVSVGGAYRSYELTALAGKSVGSTQDFDLSQPADRQHRNFIGGQLRYLGWERHEPFAYVFWQRDQNSEGLFPLNQEYDYDSFYVGVGSVGELVENLRYAAEWVYETGESYGHRQFLSTDDIRAWAWDMQLEYLFPGSHKPRASVEYIFGSGDGDRFASPTNSFGGNLAGDDTGFNAFGWTDTGLALAPLYTNLHTWRTGASYFPWPEHRRLELLQVGTDWFLFFKHHRTGAISDPTADRASSYVGWEMDYFANWRVSADVAWTVRWGLFFPGQAYSDTSPRSFFMVGMTWSF